MTPSSTTADCYLRRAAAFAVTAAIAATGLPATMAMAQEASFVDFPFLIVCNYMGIENAYYFSELNTDGIAIYLTPDRQAGSISIDGVGHRVGGDRPGSCQDKTLDELRAAGQAFDLPH